MELTIGLFCYLSFFEIRPRKGETESPATKQRREIGTIWAEVLTNAYRDASPLFSTLIDAMPGTKARFLTIWVIIADEQCLHFYIFQSQDFLSSLSLINMAVDSAAASSMGFRFPPGLVERREELFALKEKVVFENEKEHKRSWSFVDNFWTFCRGETIGNCRVEYWRCKLHSKKSVTRWISH